MLFYSRELIRATHVFTAVNTPVWQLHGAGGSHSEAVEPGAVVAHALLQQVLRSLYRLHRERICVIIYGTISSVADFSPSRISDPKTATKERGRKKMFCPAFFQGCGSVFTWYVPDPIRIRIQSGSGSGSNPYPDPIRIRIQSVSGSNPDPGVLMTKNRKKFIAENFFNFFW